MSDAPSPDDNSLAAEKVRSFPRAPGVYLMKDAAGRVIYVGKAKDLRNRAGSYFLKAADDDPRTARLVQEIRDVDYPEAESEMDALPVEAITPLLIAQRPLRPPGPYRLGGFAGNFAGRSTDRRS